MKLEAESTIQATVIDLASDAFDGFCQDIGGMFGVEMSCEQMDISEAVLADIKKKFKRVAAVYSVKSSGPFSGEFQILFDKAGLFTMAGVVVMLPESRVLSNAKRGTLADANEMSDAIGEVGNLLIGCWGQIFRSDLRKDTHFSQTGTFIGDPCPKENGVLDLPSGDSATFVSYEMSVGDYPPFQCGLYLPSKLFEGAESAPAPPPEPEPKAEAEVEAAPAPDPEPEVQDAAEQAVNEETVSEPEQVVPGETDLETETDAEAAEAAAPVEEPPVAVEPEDPSEASAVSEPEAGPVSDPEPEPQDPAIAPDDVEEEAAQDPTPEQTAVTEASGSDDPEAGLLAKDLMQSDVHWVLPDDTVQQAQARMQQTGGSYLLVGKGSQLEGIVTQSDLAGAVSIYLRSVFAKWHRPEDDATLQIRIKWIMSRQIYAVKADTPLVNMANLLCKHDISCLPVVDAKGHVQGAVTTKDVLKTLLSKELDAVDAVVASSP